MSDSTVSSMGEYELFFNPHDYFKTREGLYVWESFDRDILEQYEESIPYRVLGGIVSTTFIRNMSDQEIIDELLGGMLEARRTSCTLDQIADKINLQQNGEYGNLLNNGCPNIFYVLVKGKFFAVSICWGGPGSKSWLVVGFNIGGREWCPGTRVFYNTTLTC